MRFEIFSACGIWEGKKENFSFSRVKVRLTFPTFFFSLKKLMTFPRRDKEQEYFLIIIIPWGKFSTPLCLEHCNQALSWGEAISGGNRDNINICSQPMPSTKIAQGGKAKVQLVQSSVLKPEQAFQKMLMTTINSPTCSAHARLRQKAGQCRPWKQKWWFAG